jgi:hypothetical protein
MAVRRRRRRVRGRYSLRALLAWGAPTRWIAIATGVVLAIVLAGVVLPLAFSPAKPHHRSLGISCPKVPTVHVGKIVVPRGPVAGYCQPQLVNAAAIINAGRSTGVDKRIQSIGVMTAIGESGLRNLNYGDAVGPDSRGLFQQRSNWGTLKQRMTPFTAARRFFIRLLGVPGWNHLTPTQAAHAVQRNADPGYYAQFYDRAQVIVAALTAAPTPRPTPSG